jgi:hypothetical protein
MIPKSVGARVTVISVASHSLSVNAGPLAVLTKSQISGPINLPSKALEFLMEPRMRNRLQVSLWGLSLDAQGIVAIAAALLIVLVFALLLTGRF